MTAGKRTNSGQFKKGQSGNPKGRAKLGGTLAEKFRDALNQVREGDYTYLDLLIDIAIQQAQKGNLIALQYVLARAYGAVPDRIELKKEEEFDLSRLSDEELTMLESLRRKMNDRDV